MASGLGFDEQMMARAIELAQKGRYTTRPNPCVGCVIVKDGVVIGEGFHQRAGLAHAEVVALQDVAYRGYHTNGSCAYVTLEPCSHYGKTPPCARALIEAGVGRVVIACLDPNPKVSGSGVRLLQQAGIEVVVGVLKTQAQELNAGFLKAMSVGLPYVRLKMGISLDGRVAMKSGESKWITSQAARQDVQRLRAMSGAIITGSATIIADNPKMTVRSPIDGISPADIAPIKLVVMDRSKALTVGAYQALNEETLFWGGDIPSLLYALVKDHECYDVLVESGPLLASSFLRQGWIDELIIYQAPCLLGATARPMFCETFDTLCQRLPFELISSCRIGDDLKITLRPNPAAR